MFSKKKRDSSTSPPRDQPPTSPLPRLQQLTHLETELIRILGSRNVKVDPSADIFTRLEEIYLGSLQGAPLGRELLEKCLRVLGDCDSPARVRFLYLYAHQMKMTGAASDELQPVLLDAFHCALALRHKVELGFKAALAFCQISTHTGEVDKTLSNLIVTLEQELDYHPHSKPKIKKQHSSFISSTFHNNHSDLKIIYLGAKLAHKHDNKRHQEHPYGRLQKLGLYRLLYEAFVTGDWKVQSEAKRKYYQECREELRTRMMREYPGREIERKLMNIQEEKFVTLDELGKVLTPTFGRDCFGETATQSTLTRTPSTIITPNQTLNTNTKVLNKPNNRSKSQFSLSAGFQSLKTSFLRDPQGSTWGAATTTITPNANRTPSRKASFKLHIKGHSNHKTPIKTPTEEQQVLQFSNPSPEVTKLVFKERQNTGNSRPSSSHHTQSVSSKGKDKNNMERKPSVHLERKGSVKGVKGLVLKFDKLQKDKLEIKKKKLGHNFNWQRNQKENNQLQHVFDIQCLPEIHEEKSLNSNAPSPSHLHQKQHHEHPDKNQANPPSVSQLNSARIDQLLKEGVQWISKLDGQQPHQNHQKPQPQPQPQHQSQPQPQQNPPVISHTNLEKHECSFSDTQNINESRVDSLLSPPKEQIFEKEILEEVPQLPEEREVSRKASYKIGIQRLQRPQVYLIISEEVQTFLSTLREVVIDRSIIKEAERMKRRQSVPTSECTPLPQRPQRQVRFQPSIIQAKQTKQAKKDASNDSQCQRLYLASQSAFQSIVREVERDQEDSCVEQEASGAPSVIILPSEITEFQQEEERIAMQNLDTSRKVIISEPKLTQQDLGQLAGIWLMGLYDNISLEFAKETPKKEYPSQDKVQQGKSSRRSLPILPLSRLKLKCKCSIKAEDASSSSSRRRPKSIDDKDLEQQKAPMQGMLIVQLPPFERSRELIQGRGGQLQLPQQASHFTCSRFAGSKIDTEKESDCQWRSQMNFMNEIFRNDRNNEVLPLLQIPQGNPRRSREDFDGEESESRYRSRSQSDLSRSSSGGIAREPSISNRSQQRQKTHVCLSFSYNDSFDAITHSKRFTHWLAPELRVAHNHITLALHTPHGQILREVRVPAFVAVNDDTVREVSGKVETFLAGLPQKESMGEQGWDQINKLLEQVDLLPDEVDLKPFLLPSPQEGPQDEIRCSANLKTLKITLTSSATTLKVSPIVALSLQDLESIVSTLDPSKVRFLLSQFFPTPTQILIRGVWCLAGQRSIKMRQKFQGNVNHFIFDVLERYNQGDRFDYCVREQQCGESLTFQGIQLGRRTKILKNMDTIIGFCLKTNNGKIKFSSHSLTQFLTLL